MVATKKIFLPTKTPCRPVHTCGIGKENESHRRLAEFRFKSNTKLATLWRQISWSQNRCIMTLKTAEKRKFYLGAVTFLRRKPYIAPE
ncbi:MAG: DUF1016 domain-containing protein [Gammaproteobacteria bacterium]|nr:DUF1016 domain-containing protein [Gammaproteobacteria bacterium]